MAHFAALCGAGAVRLQPIVSDSADFGRIPCSSAWTGQVLPLSTINVHSDGSFDIEQANEYIQTPSSIRSYVESWAAWGEETGTPM